jgi:LPXTG-motif cell wall-anchored protein
MTEHVSGRRIVAGGLATMAVGAVALVGAFPGAASATGGDEFPFDHPCPGEGWYFHWGPDNQETIPGEHNQDDPAVEEDYSGEGEFSVTISNVRVEEERKTFDFETSIPVELVFAMGWPETDHEGTTYEYEPPVTAETVSVADDTYIKHVVFCPAPETPPTTEPTTTSTEAPTTTSTEAPTTTSTVPPSTGDTTPPSTDAPPSSDAPTTAPPTTQPIADERLPETGSTTMPLLAGAGALLAVGVALVAGKRYMQNRA